MRNNVVFHDYESLSHIGMPLVLFSLVLSYLRQLFGNRPVYCLSIAALWIFCSSSYQMGRVGHSAAAADFHHAIIAGSSAESVGRIEVLLKEVWVG